MISQTNNQDIMNSPENQGGGGRFSFIPYRSWICLRSKIATVLVPKIVYYTRDWSYIECSGLYKIFGWVPSNTTDYAQEKNKNGNDGF